MKSISKAVSKKETQKVKTWIVKAGGDSEEVKAIDAGSAVIKVMRKYQVSKSQRNQFSAKLKTT